MIRDWECVNFDGNIIEIGIEKQQAKYWHNRNKFEQNALN